MENNALLEFEYKELKYKMLYWQMEYDKGHPVISDQQWDEYYWRFIELEKMLGYADTDSPTQRIIYEVKNELQKVEHNHPMLSLDKTKDINEVINFISEHDWICMAKMDGLTCSLTYRGGRLIRAETRGNGLVGEDITHNAYVIPSIPKTIPIKEECVIDGEVICTYDNFEKFKGDYSNPRNFASGSIRLLDSGECEKRGLIFVAWDWIKGYKYVDWDMLGYTRSYYLDFNLDDKTLANKLFALEHIGFTSVPWVREAIEYGSNLDDRMKIVKEEAEKLSYPIDGLVFKYNNCEEYEAAGRTDHHFKGGLAYKFYDELYETKLCNIEWSMGRTGVLTPVAIFEEVEIDGAICNRASLHNVSIMHELLGRPYVGQKIRIFRANQIIPQVYDAEISKSNSPSPLSIDKCPICQERLKLNNNDGVITLICPNENCDGKMLNKLDHLCGKKGLDIKGISKATLEKLMDWGWVKNLEDIFTLKEYRNEWIKKDGFGEKSVDRILDAIDFAANNTELESFISALGIPLIGKTVARELVKIFPTYESFREAVAAHYDFQQLPNFGMAKEEALLTFDYHSGDIIRQYLNIKEVSFDNIENSFENKTFCVTGKLKFYKNRAEIKDFIEKRGGRVVDSMSSKVDYLINNDIESTSKKNQTAKELGIPIITESQFNELI